MRDEESDLLGASHVRTRGDTHHRRLLGQEAPLPATPEARLAEYQARVQRLAEQNGLFEKLEIELSLGCNRRCTYCFLATERRQDHVQSRTRVMPQPLFDLLLDQLTELEFRGVLCFHFYNEPLLNPHLHRYVAAARKRLPDVQMIIYTNADLLDEARYHELTTAGINLIYVTRHDNAVPATLAPVLKLPGVLIDMRADMEFNNRGGYLGPPVDDRMRTLPCVYPSECAIITIDGNVLPCSCDFRESMKFGNIREQHLRDIYLSPAAIAFRRDLLAGRRQDHALCKDCDWYAEVLGLPSSAEAHREREQPLLTVRRVRT